MPPSAAGTGRQCMYWTSGRRFDHRRRPARLCQPAASSVVGGVAPYGTCRQVRFPLWCGPLFRLGGCACEATGSPSPLSLRRPLPRYHSLTHATPRSAPSRGTCVPLSAFPDWDTSWSHGQCSATSFSTPPESRSLARSRSRCHSVIHTTSRRRPSRGTRHSRWPCCLGPLSSTLRRPARSSVRRLPEVHPAASPPASSPLHQAAHRGTDHSGRDCPSGPPFDVNTWAAACTASLLLLGWRRGRCFLQGSTCLPRYWYRSAAPAPSRRRPWPSTVKFTDYSFLANVFAARGYMAISIQHDLPTDAPMVTRVGELYVGRQPQYLRGVANIKFAVEEMQKVQPNADYDHLTLVGHSTGADISMYFAKLYPERTK